MTSLQPPAHSQDGDHDGIAQREIASSMVPEVSAPLQGYNTSDAVDQHHERSVDNTVDVREQDDVRIDVDKSIPGDEIRSPPLILHWYDLGYRVKVRTGLIKRKEKVVLYPQSAYVKPGEVLAIMGPSGSGKTSLLNILAQRVRKFDGQLKVNGQKAKSKMRSLMSFVQQDDVMLANLTVYETLRYAALLRVPKTKYKAKMKLVNSIIGELGLEGCRNTKVGKAGVSKGISGGERKRLAIGVELLSRPSILFLDEPTTGLDASAALHVMETIQKVALKGRTVVLTLHQPRSNIYMLFNRLILLAKGHMVYFGDAQQAPNYFQELGYSMPKNYNPADFMLDTISSSSTVKAGRDVTPEEDQKRVQTIIDSYKPVEVDSELQIPEDLTNIKLKKYTRYASNFMVQLLVIFWRSILNIFRDRAVVVARFIQAVFIALLVGFVYLRIGYNQKNVQDRGGALFFAMVNQSMNTMFSSIHVFQEENPVFLRERGARSYRVWTYFVAKSVAELPLALIFPLLFGVICYWMIGFNSDFDRFLVFLFLMMYISVVFQAFGEAISCLVNSEQVATTLATVSIIILLLFGGYYLNTDTLPVYTIWLYWISPFHYGFEALYLNEFSNLTFRCDPGEICQFRTGQDAINYYGFNNALSNKWLDCALLAAIFVVCKTLAFFGLLFVKRPKGA